MAELCIDEGCPHHGTEHVCIDLAVETRQRAVGRPLDIDLTWFALEPWEHGPHGDGTVEGCPGCFYEPTDWTAGLAPTPIC